MRCEKKTKDAKYDPLSLPSNKCRFIGVNFLINGALEHLRMRCLLGGGVYFTFPSQNAAFIGGRRLKEEIQYPLPLK